MTTVFYGNICDACADFFGEPQKDTALQKDTATLFFRVHFACA